MDQHRLITAQAEIRRLDAALEHSHLRVETLSKLVAQERQSKTMLAVSCAVAGVGLGWLLSWIRTGGTL